MCVCIYIYIFRDWPHITTSHITLTTAYTHLTPDQDSCALSLSALAARAPFIFSPNQWEVTLNGESAFSFSELKDEFNKGSQRFRATAIGHVWVPFLHHLFCTSDDKTAFGYQKIKRKSGWEVDAISIILLWQSYHPLEKCVIGNMGFVICSLQETLAADWYRYEMKRI